MSTSDLGVSVGNGEQIVTIAAVLLGAMSTHLTNFLMERSRHRRELTTRWDDKKLETYAAYIDCVRASIFHAVHLYEVREGIREDDDRSEEDIRDTMVEAGQVRGRAFERVMLLAADDVVEAAHELNAAALAVDWQATGKTSGSRAEWRDRNRAAFRLINDFHETARVDLGVSGSVTGEAHAERDLLLPPARRESDQRPT